MSIDASFDTQVPSPSKGPHSSLSPIKTFLGMFIWPRQIIRSLLDAGPLWSVTLLLTVISGARSGIQNGLEKLLEDPRVGLGVPLATAVVAPMIGSLIGFFLFGWVYYGLGKSLGGAGSQSDVYHAFARGLVPSFAGFVPLGVMVLLAGSGQAHTAAYAGMALVYVVILIWSSVSLIRGLAEAHRFSSWRSLAAFIVCFLLFIIVILAVVMVIAAVGILG